MHPIAGSHESTVQTSLSSQFTAGPLRQVSFWHVSFAVQALPSLQGAVLFVCTQAAVGVPASSHVSSVQGLLSSQSVSALQIEMYSHVSPRRPESSPPPKSTMRLRALS